MRRCLIAFLTLVVAVQFSWAAAATCCIDELASAQAVAVELLSSADADTPTPPCDVGHCHCQHGSLATSVDSPLGLAPGLMLQPQPGRHEARPSHIPDGLDRPNWLRA